MLCRRHSLQNKTDCDDILFTMAADGKAGAEEPHGDPSQGLTRAQTSHQTTGAESSNHALEKTPSGRRIRSDNFDPEAEPFREDDRLHLQYDKVTGPFRRMAPTRALFSYVAEHVEPHAEADSSGFEELTNERSEKAVREGGFDIRSAGEVEYNWTSRNNRKGRHALIVHENPERANPYATPPATTGPRPTLQGIWRMMTVFTIHDVSYLLALAFTLASATLAANAVLSFLPYITHRLQSSHKLLRIEAVLGALGCTLFFTGTLFAFAEAVNVNRRGCFGWKLIRVARSSDSSASSLPGGNLAEDGATLTLLVPDGSCVHHHDSYKVIAGNPSSWHRAVHQREALSVRPEDKEDRTKQPWIWLPSWEEVRTHLRYDFGFVTATTLAASSAIYCAMAWTVVGTIFTHDSIPEWIRFPQLVAALGFTVSCALSMIETQRNWWRPSPTVIGWHANVFNVLGSAGFGLTAVFGYVKREAGWAEYQSGCAYLWGEWNMVQSLTPG